ncbi:MAG TPA: LuxR C-terminal-related transcriptional regulator [Bryobacteraceae bacterium]|nr:LuxR C-terminal-related transcriptional regulator [Bryobacteraceae bacterium]
MPHLSRREMQLVLLVRQAKTNKEIAAELCLSPGTAKQYLHVLFRKLGIRNRTELAMWGNLNLGGLLAASGEAEPGAYS